MKCKDFYSVKTDDIIVPCTKDDESFKGFPVDNTLPFDENFVNENLSKNEEEANKIIQCINEVKDIIDSQKKDIDDLDKFNTLKMKFIEYFDNIYPYLTYIIIRKLLLSKYYNIEYDFDIDCSLCDLDFLLNEIDTIKQLDTHISVMRYVEFDINSSNIGSIKSDNKNSNHDKLKTSLNSLNGVYHNYTSNIDTSTKHNKDIKVKLKYDMYGYDSLEYDFLTDINDDKFHIDNKDADDESSGSLYDKFYNKLDDPLNNFFTLDERGLTDNPSDIDDSFSDYNNHGLNMDKVTQAEYKIGDVTYYIKDKSKFEHFFTKNAANIETLIFDKKSELVSNELNDILSLMLGVAKYEVGDIIINGGDIEYLMNLYDNQIENLILMLTELANIINLISGIKSKMDIENVKNELKNKVICIEDTDPPTDTPTDNGSNWSQFPTFNGDTLEIEDPLDPENPNQGKHCYWLQFAKLATIYGLFPWIDLEPKDPGIGIRYWPIGLKIPTPAGKMINIPFPIVWIPIFTMSLPAIGTIVFFIGQAGIFPGLYVMYINRMGIKKFVLTFHGQSDEMGYDPTGDEPNFRFNVPLALWKSNLDLSDNPLDKKIMEKFTSKHKFDEFKESAINKIIDGIDKIGLPDMPDMPDIPDIPTYDLNESEKRKFIDDYVAKLTSNLTDFINDIKLPKVDIVIDMGKKKSVNSLEHIINVHKRFGDNNYLDKFGKQIDLKDIFNKAFNTTKFSSEFNNLIMPETINIDNDEHYKRFIQYIKKWMEVSVRLIGENEFIFDLLEYPNFKITTPFDCKTIYEADKIDTSVVDVILGYTKIIWAGLDLIDKASIKDILGVGEFSVEYLFDMGMSIINTLLVSFPIPAITLYPTYGKALLNVFKSIGMTIIPEIKFELPQRALDLTLDLNDVKAPIISTLSSFESLFYGFGYELPDIDDLTNFEFYYNFFTGFSPIDLKMVVIDLVTKTLDGFFNTIKPIYDGANMAVSIYGLTQNIVDSIFLPSSMFKMLKKMLKNKGLEYSIEIPNKYLMEASMKAMKYLDIVPFPVVSLACSFGMGDIIRKIHPIMPSDDLPPWERLTLNNFLFNVFLDDFCHNGKMYGGFQENIL